MTNTLTALQYQLMNLVAHAEHNPGNGATPTCAEDVNTWFWADELAASMGITEKAVGGVVTSLQEADLIGVNIVTKAQKKRTGDDSGIWFTEAGFDAWKAMHDAPAPKAKKAALSKGAKAKEKKIFGTAAKNGSKYDYPAGLTTAQKKVFRAKMRRAFK